MRLISLLFLISTVCIILYTAYAAFHYSSNAVLGRDEASYVIVSGQKIINATSVGDLVDALFPNHGQHLLFGMQLINVATYTVTGFLDRRIMNVIGVAILCFAALLMQKGKGSSLSEKLLLFATIFPLALSPTHNACIVNAACTGNHYLGIALSVLSLYFFTRSAEKIHYLMLAEFFMMLAIFSLPASLALIPVSLLVLFVTQKRKNIRLFAGHLVFIVFILMVHSYFTYPDTIFTFLNKEKATPFVDATSGLLMFVVTSLLIVGSMFYWLADMGYGLVLVIVGAIVSILIAWSVWLFIKTTDRNKYQFHFYGVILFLLMILIISFGRFYNFGSSRYAAYTAFLYISLFLLAFEYFTFCNKTAEHRRLNILCCTAVLSLMHFSVAYYYHHGYLASMDERAIYCRELWHTKHQACGVMVPHPEASALIQGVVDQGIYRVEK